MRFFASVLLVLSLLVLPSFAAESPPNIVLIIGDDQGWGDFGFMGHPDIRTPHLDALADESITFTRGYVVSSLCRPSLATLATGLYPHQHGITGNDPTERKSREEYLALNAEWIEQFQETPRVAGVLAEAGYVSHQSGKWWEGPCRCGEFTEGMTHGDPERRGRHGDEGLIIGRETMEPVFDFIDRAGDNPFFIWYAPFLPHTPHNPPDRLLEHYKAEDRPLEVAKYYAMCEWLDETVGQLLGHLDTRGLREDTLVLFITDNGWVQPLKDGEGWRSPFGAPRGKRSPYDGGLRTPVILHQRGAIEPARVDTPVSSVDIAPTIARAAGLEPPANWPGIDLRDLEAVGEREAIYGANFSHDAVDIRRPHTSLDYRYVVRFPWKLILPYSPNQPFAPVELFNIERDPDERENLAYAVPERVSELRAALETWWRPGLERLDSTSPAR